VLNHVAGKFLNRSFDAWHSVSCDSLVGTCIRNQRPLVLSYPRSAAATELRRLAKALVRERSQASGSSGCWEVVHAVG
jgi:MinD-like ATPase involved in chromosome partitioning or flagellar assembly